MYFPIGWPKVLRSLCADGQAFKQIVSNRDKILFASLSDDSFVVWFCKVDYLFIILVIRKRYPKGSSVVVLIKKKYCCDI